MRNYAKGRDLSWQEVFQTSDETEVESYCNSNQIEFIWHGKNSDLELTTKQLCQASVKHPTTKENVWFNQAHLFHLSALSKDDQSFLINTLGINSIPRNAFYGNGEDINPNDLNHIRSVYKQLKIKFQWHKGDIMILDNLLMAHSREPFEGTRKVAVAMS